MVNTTQIGRRAELAVAHKLQAQGFLIGSLNWRTRWCEIDIVATKQEVVYFIEVKFRSSASHGHGIEYITPTKLKQMQFAAEFWCAKHAWLGDCELAVVSVSNRFEVDDLVLV